MRDKPIFMDSTGKRRRLFTMIAAAAGVLMATAVAVLVAGFVGPSSGHLPGLPDLHPGQQEVARVPPPPTPSASSTGGSPRTRPSTAPPAPSTSDARGNNGNGNNPSNRPDHPHPTKSK